jgi:hypothetical protein
MKSLIILIPVLFGDVALCEGSVSPGAPPNPLITDTPVPPKYTVGLAPVAVTVSRA